MPKRPNLNGRVFGHLTVTVTPPENKNNARHWECLCVCGKVCHKTTADLLRWAKSCGCKAGDGRAKHGGARDCGKMPEYSAWCSMKARCSNKNLPNFNNYGGRGIKVCERWLKFENFIADMGRKPTKAHSIERINNNGNYEPSNCKWATRFEQTCNRRCNIIIEHNGRRLTASQIGDAAGLTRKVLYQRLRKMTIAEAVAKPIKGRERHQDSFALTSILEKLAPPLTAGDPLALATVNSA